MTNKVIKIILAVILILVGLVFIFIGGISRSFGHQNIIVSYAPAVVFLALAYFVIKNIGRETKK